jgi:peptidoglycan/xylan/chitin deacetylase (PgdA/CDA1 family)
LLAGNAVGVHSYDHADYTTLTDAQQQMETMDAKQAIRNATGTDATLFRYPYGKSTAFTDSQLSSWGFTAPAVYWTYAPEDWYPLCPSAATIQQRLLSNITNGSVILLHDVSYCGVDQFDYLVPTINALKSQGYAFGILGPNLYPPNPSSVTSHG